MVVKHTNPCGIASRGDLQEAYRLAVRADPISAFGGIVAFNRCAGRVRAAKAKRNVASCQRIRWPCVEREHVQAGKTCDSCTSDATYVQPVLSHISGP